METELRRFSGYRIRFVEQAKQAWHWGNLRNSLQANGLPQIFEAALQEPFFIDDDLRGMDPLDLLMYALRDGEIFACFADGELIGICSFRDIKHCRSAQYDAWVAPEHRGPEGKAKIYQLVKEVMEYAFRDFPKGLGLKKVKADIAMGNLPALVTAQRLGFIQVGQSPLDAFHNGELHDSLLLELLNPEFFGSAVEVIKTDEFRRGFEQAASGTAVRSDEGSAELRIATGSERDSSGSDERETDSPEGELSGGLHDDGQEGSDSGDGSDSRAPAING